MSPPTTRRHLSSMKSTAGCRPIRRRSACTKDTSSKTKLTSMCSGRSRTWTVWCLRVEKTGRATWFIGRGSFFMGRSRSWWAGRRRKSKRKGAERIVLALIIELKSVEKTNNKTRTTTATYKTRTIKTHLSLQTKWKKSISKSATATF